MKSVVGDNTKWRATESATALITIHKLLTLINYYKNINFLDLNKLFLLTLKTRKKKKMDTERERERREIGTL